MKHSINKKNRNTFKNIMNLDKDDLEFLSLIMSHRNIIDVQKAYKHKPCEPCYDDRQYTSVQSPHPLEISLFGRNLNPEERLRYFGSPHENPYPDSRNGIYVDLKKRKVHRVLPYLKRNRKLRNKPRHIALNTSDILKERKHAPCTDL